MPSKELIEKVALDLALLNDGTEGTWESYHADAQKACSTILAALQEPTGEMCKAGRNETIGVGHFYASDIWRVMLAASALGEQSE